MKILIKTFAEGIGSAIDLGDHLTEFEFFEDDQAAIASDWNAVGEDMSIVIDSHAEEVRDRLESRQ